MARVRQAAVLVGGLGTRLKDLTRSTPKPLLLVGGRPFIDYLLDELARYGIEEILLLAGFCADQVLDRYDGKDWRGARIRVVIEPEPLGTAGALRNAAAELDDAFLLMNGDSFFDFNLLDLTHASLSAGALGRLALRDGVVGTRYGRIEQHADGRAAGFFDAGARQTGPINAGVYLFSRALLDFVPAGKVSLEAEVMPELARLGRLEARNYSGYFIDMGVPDDFKRAQVELPLKVRRPAAFLDRDGVLNHDHGYVSTPEKFDWVEGAKPAVKRLNDLGFLVFVVTNQAGVARGYYGEDAVQSLHEWVQGELAEVGAHVDAFSYCPHHVDGIVAGYARPCRRRKPEPGMLNDLAAAWTIDLGSSFMIGDKPSDLQAAHAAGVQGVPFDCTAAPLDRFIADIAQVRRIATDAGA